MPPFRNRPVPPAITGRSGPRTFVRLVAVLALAAIAVTPPVQGQTAISQGSFITRLGTDTLAVESFVRTATKLEGEIIWRSPVYAAAHYVAALGSNGRPTALEITILDGLPGSNAYNYRTASVTWLPDTVTAVIQLDTGVIHGGTARGASPTLPYSWALHELHTEALLGNALDSVRLPIFAIGVNRGLTAGNLRVEKLSPDTIRMWNILAAGAAHLRVDERGRILEVDGSRSTSRYRVERRSEPIDVRSLISTIGVAERSEKRFGSVIAVYDTAVATIAGKDITIIYSPPKVRGREVFKNGVLGDTLWRTGANMATHLRTGATLVIGGDTIPPGLYTIFTSIAPDNSTYTLIVNAQTGQWGYTYDRARDLLRVPLSVSTIPHTEQFTIAIEPNAAGDGGTLALRWATTQLAVEFKTPRE